MSEGNFPEPPDESQAISIRADVRPERALEFLERLADDDDFRERFRTSAGDVLSEYGIQIPADKVPGEVKVPPREMLIPVVEEIRRVRDFGGDVAGFWGYSVPFIGMLSFCFGGFAGEGDDES